MNQTDSNKPRRRQRLTLGLLMGMGAMMFAAVSIFIGAEVPTGAAEPSIKGLSPGKVGSKNPADKVPQKSFPGVIAEQTTTWGNYKIKACAQGIRIATQHDVITVAAPPDWTVYIYKKGQQRAAKIPYAMFLTKNLRAVKLSQIGKPHTKRLVGVNALQYDFHVNQRLDDTTMGGLYRSRGTPPIVLTKEVVFAPNINYLPKKLKGIWATFFEIPIVEEIPMQVVLHLNTGETRAYFNTKSFKQGTATAEDFRVPPGLTYTAQFAEMIYGKEMESVADLLYK